MDVKNEKTTDIEIAANRIMDDYRKAKIEISAYGNKKDAEFNKYSLAFLNKKLDNLSPRQFMLTVDSVLDTLTDHNRELFLAMYMRREPAYNSLWYQDYCMSRSTYYRYKRKALEEFMRYFI